MGAQRGGGTLAALLAVLVISLMVMAAWQRQLDLSLALLNDEQRYLAAFHQAESALAWGARQYWHAEHAQCRQPEGETFRACLLADRRAGRWILRGESGAGDVIAGPLRLYRQVELRPITAPGAGDGGALAAIRCGGDKPCFGLSPHPGGWLDYLPR
ncbi:DUF2509 family protein [Sodalis sp. RH21]|uniref:DUF2509 family protein n=1 Tax=unclassified Sodalis (in: enterobacteria) TaxID=2636512 RepID=UPI0039B3A58D